MVEPSNPNPRMGHTVPHLRLLALIGLAVVFIFYQPGAPGLLHNLLLPLVALLSAWYITGSLVAIALAVMLLSLAHADRDSAQFAEAVLYPALGLLAGAIVAVALALRFRAAMLRRRAQREIMRTRDDASQDPP